MKRIPLFFLSLVLCLSLLFGISQPVSAYSFNGAKITSPMVFYAYSGFGSTTKSHMRSAALQWNALIDDFAPLVMSTSTHSISSGDTFYQPDGKNCIYRFEAGTQYVAQTRLTIVSAVLTEFDININVSHSWANSAQPNCYDVYSIMLHELGHAMGLADLYDGSGLSYDTAVMWYKAYQNSTKRELKQDDINGIAAKYN